jgi:hypothetical protein
MTPAFTARRRADEFDNLVEGTSTRTLRDARHAELLELVGALRAVPPVEARPEFVSDLRAQLMLAAESTLVPVDESRLTLPPRRPRRDRRIAAAVGGLVIAGATTSVAVAAQHALPGDALYPLKRAIENADAGLQTSDRERGTTLLSSASGRLQEVAALSREGRLEDSAAIADTLNTFSDQATEASGLLLADYEETGQESSIAELRDFTGASMETLERLEGVVPVDARDELLHAARVLAQIDVEAAEACPQCAGQGIADIPAVLTSAGYARTDEGLLPSVDDVLGTVGGETGQDPQLPGTGGDLGPGSVLNPPTETDTSTPSTGGSPEVGEDPLGDLTDTLTGKDDDGDKNTSGGGGGLPGVDDVEDTVEDVTEGVTDGLGDALN